MIDKELWPVNTCVGPLQYLKCIANFEPGFQGQKFSLVY